MTTATKTITRTISNSELNIKDNTINYLTFDISGTEHKVEQSDYYHFNLGNIKELANVTGSNTGTKPWTHTGCDVLKDVGNSQFNNALRIKTTKNKDNTTTVGVVTYTAIPNKSLKRIRFYGHPRATTGPVTINVKSGEAAIGSVALNYNDISPNGGYNDFEVPEAYSQSNLAFSIDKNPAAISAATLFFNE